MPGQFNWQQTWLTGFLVTTYLLITPEQHSSTQVPPVRTMHYETSQHLTRETALQQAAPWESLQVTAFQMLTKIAWVESLAGGVGDQRFSRETAPVAPDILAQPVEQRLQIACGDIFAQ